VSEHFGNNDVPDGAGTTAMKRSQTVGTGKEALGQVIVLFALMLTAFLGFAALAIDVSNAYSQERFQKAAADAASLAGAQDLFQPNSRAVPTDGPLNARTNAMALLVRELGATRTPTTVDGPDCLPSSPVADCLLPDTPYRVWITTPSPTCVSCDPDRSVQVTIHRPGFQLTFGRLFGQSNWTISTTSVSGITSSIRYGLVVLRVPNPNRNNTNDPNVDDLNANGNSTVVRITGGDIGVNTNVTDQLTPPCVIQLDVGYNIYHNSVGEPWCKNSINGIPKGVRIQGPLIDDPNYLSIDQFNAITNALNTNPTTNWTGQNAGQGLTPGEDVGCANASSLAPGAVIPPGARCYRPGFYPSTGNGSGASAFTVQNSEWAFLYPGVYFFDGNVTINGKLTGGNVSLSQGVALLLRKDKTFKNNNSPLVSLNMGTAGCADDTCRATPANSPFGPLSSGANVPLTIIVEKYPGCFVSGTNVPHLCTDTGSNDSLNNTLNLAGGADLHVAGIIYAPSDRVQVASNNGIQTGTLGQIVAWQITYTGNTALNQSFPGLFQSGVLRIDSACTKGSPATPCNAP